MHFWSNFLKDRLGLSTPTRAMLLLSFVMIAIAVTIAGAVLIEARERELAHAKNEIVSLNRILAEQTTRTFDGVVLMLRGAQERLSDGLGRNLELDSLPVQLLLRARISGLPQVKSLFIIDRDGYGVNSSRPDFIRRLSVHDRAFFRHYADGASDELFVSLPEKAKVDDAWTFYVSSRLLDQEGRFRGVLVAAISIEYFESLYSSISLDFVDRIFLLNNDGTLLAGRSHDEQSFGIAGIAPAVLAELRGGTGNSLISAENSPDGKRYVAYRQVAKYPLIISATIKEHEALTPWRRLAQLIAAGVALVIIFVLMTTLLVIRAQLRREVLESELREADEQRRQMVQSIRDAIITVDSGLQVVLFNRAAENMFGISAGEAMRSELGEWLPRCVREPQGTALVRCLKEALQSPASVDILGLIELGAQRQKFPVELSLSTTTVRGKILVTAVFHDLTESQRTAKDLLASNRQLQELSASLQNIREIERSRIARELHDELGQLLTGMRMEVSWLGGRLAPDQQKLVDKVESVKGLIDQTIVSVRRIAAELRPLVLDDLGFSAAAGWYVDQFSARNNLPVKLQLPAADPEQGGAVATALFRVMQESLTNIARHAQASLVDITLERRDDAWVLSIQDDGLGFAATSKPGSIGLLGMRERVNILGGLLRVESLPGKGTLIEAVIPAEARNENSDGKI